MNRADKDAAPNKVRQTAPVTMTAKAHMKERNSENDDQLPQWLLVNEVHSLPSSVYR